MVLRVHVVRDGGHAYYVDDLVPGRAEGTLVAGEEPGRWWGGGSGALGLAGRVDPPPFAEVLAGRDPGSGAPLRSGRAQRSVSALDLTFGAPKSVSLLHLLAPAELAEESGAAHRAGVDDALGYLERVAIGVRRSGPGGVARLGSTGMVAGAFLHRTSRALDPHLHTHAVVANVAEGVDGRWSAIDSRRVFAHAPAAQAVYHARLRHEIGERLGGAFEVAPSGLGDVVGVGRALRHLFSQRSASMREHRHAGSHGAGSWRAAFFATRPEKDRAQTFESLRAEWRDRAAAFGFDLGDLTGVIGLRHQGPDRTSTVDGDRMGSALDRLARQGRSVSRRDLVAEVAAAAVGGARAETVESVADRLIGGAGRTAEDRSGPAGCDRTHRGPEPRWPAARVARALEREGSALLAPDPGPGRPVRVTALDRSIAGPDRGRAVDRGPLRGLGRAR